MDNVLKQADICEAREALLRDPRESVVMLTPGEFRNLIHAFRKMENEIKRYQDMSIAEFALRKGVKHAH